MRVDVQWSDIYECPNCKHAVKVSGNVGADNNEVEYVDCPGCHQSLCFETHIEIEITMESPDDREV